jgi:phosphoenolpyruvate carboxylase
LESGHSADEIYKALTSQQVELVLTAHPTEVNRRTILEKQRRVQNVSITILVGINLYHFIFV